MHVIPSSKIPVDRLPLDVLVSNSVSYIRKTERRGIATSANQLAESKFASPDSVVNPQREALEKEAVSQGLFMLPEYQFDHCVYQITESNLTEEGLVYGYNKCMGFLRLKQRPEIGISVIVAPKWMFVAVLSGPYTHTKDEQPVYLDGFAFAGLVSLQTVTSKWPATAGLECDEPTVLGALERSTFIQPVVMDTEDAMDAESAVDVGKSSNAGGLSERSVKKDE